MSETLAARLGAALRGTPLAPRLHGAGAALLQERGRFPAAAQMSDAVARGLARLAASNSQAASFLAHRTTLCQRLASLDAGYLARRGQELETIEQAELGGDLEGFLDELRLLRREETVLAACLDLAGLVPFEQVSFFLSQLAEGIVRRALRMAELRVHGEPRECLLSVVGMGKIGGREFTYHSDLDLVFLFDGPAEQIVRVARVGQRLIAYLATMTGAGVAYPVDARLRPSGQQGTLVSPLDAFERYQRREARPWEHLVLMRARVIAGDGGKAQAAVERVRVALASASGSASPWPAVARMRDRVERERAREGAGRLELKTGSGGLMDYDFLAAGAALERAAEAGFPALPSVPALLRRAVPGARAEALLEGYRLLRTVEARARWLAGRAVDALVADDPTLPVLAELVEPGLPPRGLLERLAEHRRAVREAFQTVVQAGSIRALAG